MGLLAGGTLVILVPTNGGLVIAADSRTTILGTGIVCDNEHKITELANVDHTALVITGHSTVLNILPLFWKRIANRLFGKRGISICEHVMRLRKFDATDLLKRLIQQNPALAGEKFDELPDRCIDGVKAFMATMPRAFRSLKGSGVFQVGLGSYSPTEKTSNIRTFSVVIAQDGAPEIANLKIQQFRPSDRAVITPMGDVNFFKNQVFNGPGLKFLSDRYSRFKNAPGGKVEDIDVKVAFDLASELIEAASLMAQIVPDSTGIGGPIDVLLLGEEPRPIRLQWK